MMCTVVLIEYQINGGYSRHSGMAVESMYTVQMTTTNRALRWLPLPLQHPPYSGTADHLAPPTLKQLQFHLLQVFPTPTPPTRLLLRYSSDNPCASHGRLRLLRLLRLLQCLLRRLLLQSDLPNFAVLYVAEVQTRASLNATRVKWIWFTKCAAVAMRVVEVGAASAAMWRTSHIS